MAAVFTVTQGYSAAMPMRAATAQSGPSIAGLARRVQQFVEPRFGDSTFFHGHFGHRFTSLIGFFHQSGGLFITDLGGERRSHGKRLLDVSTGALSIGFEPIDQTFRKI